MALKCPRCDSSQVQSVEMIYQGGVSNSVITGVSSGVVYGSNGGAFNTTEAFGGISSSTTALAQRFAPPRLDNYKDKAQWVYVYVGIAVIGFIAMLLIGSVNANGEESAVRIFNLFAMGVTALSLGVAYYHFSGLEDAKMRDARAAKDMAVWKNTIACLSCGNTFVYKPQK